MALRWKAPWLLPSSAQSFSRPCLVSCRCALEKPWLAGAVLSGREPRGGSALLQFRNSAVLSRGFEVSGPGAVSSGLIESMSLKIKEQLSTEDVVIKDVNGDGRHVSIDVVAAAFEGQGRVSRQRMVYKAIWEELQGAVHAVDQLTTKTPDEAAKETTS